MTIKSSQKLIKIGTSAGVTIPAKDLRRGGFEVGDIVNISLEKAKMPAHSSDQDVIDAAKQILKDYKQDFDNLAKR